MMTSWCLAARVVRSICATSCDVAIDDKTAVERSLTVRERWNGQGVAGGK